MQPGLFQFSLLLLLNELALPATEDDGELMERPALACSLLLEAVGSRILRKLVDGLLALLLYLGIR